MVISVWYLLDMIGKSLYLMFCLVGEGVRISCLDTILLFVVIITYPFVPITRSH